MIQIKKIDNAASYLPRICPLDADGEFCTAVKADDEGMYAILAGEQTVGIAQAVFDKLAFLYVYIFPECRAKGFGKAALSALERQLRRPGLEEIQSCCRCTDPVARRLLEENGYSFRYASAYMVYEGGAFDLQTLPVRQYREADFQQAYAMTAEAFHKMRMEVGLSEESQPEALDEEDLRYWQDTASQRLVYLQENEIVGMAFTDGNELSTVAVKRSRQGKGIGRNLVKYTVNQIRAQNLAPIGLYCVVGNRARSLYEQLGFREVYRNEYLNKKV